MCGRFALAYPRSYLIDWYRVALMPEFGPRYNIAPTEDILVIRDSGQDRAGLMMRWGLIPSWVRDTKKLPLLFNARAESVATKPMFRHAFRRQRCLIPASGFYEWKLLPDGKNKQPFYISAKDRPLSFAGLWETATVGEAVINSCTIITTGSNDLMGPIHDRMPVILPPEVWDVWLNPTRQPDDKLLSVLLSYSFEQMRLWPVSTAVGRASNEGARLIEPIDNSLP